VALDDLVLHDAGMDVRTPPTPRPAYAYLRLRRQAATGDPEILLTPAGILRLLGRQPRSPESQAGEGAGGAEDLWTGALSSPALLLPRVPLRSRARTFWMPILWTRPWRTSTAATRAAGAVLQRAPRRRTATGFLYDETLDEAETLAAWRANFAEADALPPLLGALLLARAWRKAERSNARRGSPRLLAGLYLRRAAGRKRIS